MFIIYAFFDLYFISYQFFYALQSTVYPSGVGERCPQKCLREPSSKVRNPSMLALYSLLLKIVLGRSDWQGFCHEAVPVHVVLKPSAKTSRRQQRTLPAQTNLRILNPTLNPRTLARGPWSLRPPASNNNPSNKEAGKLIRELWERGDPNIAWTLARRIRT